MQKEDKDFVYTFTRYEAPDSGRELSPIGNGVYYDSGTGKYWTKEELEIYAIEKHIKELEEQRAVYFNRQADYYDDKTVEYDPKIDIINRNIKFYEDLKQQKIEAAQKEQKQEKSREVEIVYDKNDDKDRQLDIVKRDGERAIKKRAISNELELNEIKESNKSAVDKWVAQQELIQQVQDLDEEYKSHKK